MLNATVTITDDKIFAHVRQATGTPKRYFAYVYRRNKVVRYCSHRHRTFKGARECAERMERRYRAEIANQEGVTP